MSEDFLPMFKERGGPARGALPALLGPALAALRAVRARAHGSGARDPPRARRWRTSLRDGAARHRRPWWWRRRWAGVLVAHEVARAFGVRGLFTERQDGAMMLRRGFALEPGERVVVVEDVDHHRRLDARGDGRRARPWARVVEAVGCLIDRSGGRRPGRAARAAWSPRRADLRARTRARSARGGSTAGEARLARAALTPWCRSTA